MAKKISTEMGRLEKFLAEAVKLLQNIKEIMNGNNYHNLSREEQNSFKKSIAPQINGIKEYLKEFKERVKVKILENNLTLLN
jgi:hypothetical protein